MQAASIQTKKAKELEENTFVCGDERLLKTVAIYGANASGKSSLIKAIRACVGMIFSSHNYNENTIFAFTPFKFGGIGKPSTFFIRFLLEGIEYEYSFELNKVEILKEALYYYPNGRRSLVFFPVMKQRTPTKKNIYEFRSVIRRPMDVAANTSKKNAFRVTRQSDGSRYSKRCFSIFQ